jgi:hypothetical protein
MKAYEFFGDLKLLPEHSIILELLKKIGGWTQLLASRRGDCR